MNLLAMPQQAYIGHRSTTTLRPLFTAFIEKLTD